MSENTTSSSSRVRTITVGPGLASAALAAFLLFLFFAGWLAVHLHSRSQNRSASANTPSSSSTQAEPGSSHPKPSPLGYQQPAQVAPVLMHVPPTQIPPVQVSPGQISPSQAQVSSVNPPHSANPAATTIQPPSSIVPGMPQAFNRRFTASRDGFSNGCDEGVLAFSATSMTFTCPSDPSKNVSIDARNVVGVDKNGIMAASKQKFHFHIAGVQKDDAAPIFAEWLRNAKTVSPSTN